MKKIISTKLKKKQKHVDMKLHKILFSFAKQLIALVLYSEKINNF